MASSDTHSRLNLPCGTTCVTVKLIDICNISNVKTKSLFTTSIPGWGVLSAPSWIVLLEHPSGKKLLYDLGIRKDWQNLHTVVVERLKTATHVLEVEKDAAVFLDECGIGRSSIDAVIWSHAHWDHMGNIALFDKTTDLVVGPGFRAQFMRNEPVSHLGAVIPSDVDDRHPGIVQIGPLHGYDYFGDGSLYLIDSPGHCVGHLCALVRTSTSPDTFMLLGGDFAHHCAELRPSRYVPIPDSLSPSPLPTPIWRAITTFKPTQWFRALQTALDRDTENALLEPGFGDDMGLVRDNIAKVQKYDRDDRVLVLLAHDEAFRNLSAPKFPNAMNKGYAQGLGEKLRWTWLGQILA